MTSQVNHSDDMEIIKTIESKNFGNILALAYVYKDIQGSDSNKKALMLFEAAHIVALNQGISLEGKAKFHWGKLLLATHSESNREKGVALIVEAAIQDDDVYALDFLRQQGISSHNEDETKTKEKLFITLFNK